MSIAKHIYKIVILDDNPTLRFALHVLVQRLKPTDVQLDIYTSEDGVQGMGYIAITEPDIIIIDSTLPKYSGREIVEFISSNKKYHSHDKHILVLISDNETLDLPSNFSVLNIRSKDFLKQFEDHISKLLHIPLNTGKVSIIRKIHTRITKHVLNSTIKFANFSDQLVSVAREKGRYLKIIFLLPWLVSQLSGSLCVAILRILTGGVKDANISQSNQDNIRFRVKYYPTLLAFFLAVLFLLIQLISYLIGGLIILSQTGRVPVVTASCTPAYGNNYCYRKTVTIDNTKVSGSTDLTNFPMLFSGTYSYLATTANSGMVENANGYDIIFTSDAAGSTKLSHEVESWSATTGAITAWVKIPTLGATSDTTIYLFYGNGSISTSQEDVSNVWDSNYVVVNHLDEDPSGTAPQLIDSTSNANSGTTHNMESGDSVTGKVGKGISLDGSNEYSNKTDNASLSFGGDDITLQTWVYVPSSHVTDTAVIAKTAKDGSHSGLYFEYALQLVSSGKPRMFISYSTSGFDYAQGASAISTDAWHFMWGRWDGTTLDIYVDDTIADDDTRSGTLPDLSGSYNIGANGLPGEYFKGTLDEARVSKIARSNDWMLTEYNNQGSPSTFYSILGPSLALSTTGSQTSSLSIPSTNQYVGGTFVISNTGADSPNLTSVTIREQGSVDAQNNLDNIKLYYDLDVSSPYDCGSESYAGTETQFGSTDTDGFSSSNGTSVFTGSLAVSSTQAVCLYAVLDVTSNAAGGQSIEIDVANPSTDLTFSASSITSTSSVAITGTTTLDCFEFANGYCYYRVITIDYTKVSGGSNLTNFPFGYIVTDSALKSAANGGKIQSGNAYDVIFTSDELGTEILDYEIEKYDATTGSLVAWIRIPTLSASVNTSIYMYYNKASAANQQDPINVWDSNYVTVHHLAEDPTGTAPQMLDSTSNNLDGTTYNIEAGDLVACQIGNCLNLDGSNEYVKKTDTALLSFGGTGVTIQAWVYVPTSHPTYAIVAGKNKADGSHVSPYFEYSLHFVDSGYPRMYVATGASTAESAQSSSIMGLNGWHFLVGTYDGSNIKVYIDTVEKGTTANTATIPDFTGPYNIGANGGPGEYLKGQIDEVRVSKIGRSIGWMTTEYNNQSAPSTFATTSSEYAGSTNYAPIVTNVSLNGGSNISLTESTTTNVSWTANVTDINGYANITGANGKVYRSGVANAQNCTNDNNNCYEDTLCDLSSCSGSTCIATCTVPMQFHTDPTIAGTTYASEYWLSWITVTDAGSLTDNDFSPSSLTEVNTLVALNITNPSISYGTLLINQNSGSSNKAITVTNVGNVSIDGEILGSSLCPDYPTCAGETIPVGNQEYKGAAFTYGSGTDLTGSAVTMQLNLTKPTTSPSNSSGTIYWGIAIPTLSTLGMYTGQNTVLAVAE